VAEVGFSTERSPRAFGSSSSRSQKTLPAAEFRQLGCLSAIALLSVALDHERPGGKVETRLLKFAAGATLQSGA
jgi:hypothetical protein